MNLPGYVQAEEAFVHMTLDQRLKLQRLLAAAGYWPAVPDADFSARLFDAILRFQVDNGFAAHLPPSKTTPSVEGRQDTGAGFDQNDAGLSRVDTSEVARQRRARQLRDRAGEFDPLRLAPGHCIPATELRQAIQTSASPGRLTAPSSRHSSVSPNFCCRRERRRPRCERSRAVASASMIPRAFSPGPRQ